jgi:predicted Zn-dependent protease
VSFAGWRLLLFAAMGAASIAILAAYEPPATGDAELDRHTGKRVLIVNTAADAPREALHKGDARLALASVRRWRRLAPKLQRLVDLEETLRNELSDPPPADFGAALAERLPFPKLLEALEGALQDEEIAEATERFFAPLRQISFDGPLPCDALAARAPPIPREVAEPMDPAPYLEAARAFQAAGRTRARLRWLLRAYRASRGAAPARDALLEAYVQHGRLPEALLAVGSALLLDAENVELWRARARYAGWMALLSVEAEALERVAALANDRAARERLCAIYPYIGRAEAAVPHALALTEGSTDPAVLERPVLLALEGGKPDLGIELLRRLAASSPEPWLWRERIVELACQDLRAELALAELEALHAEFPERGYDRRLEGLLRRFDRKEQLVARLESRLRAGAKDPGLEEEVLALHYALGHADAVRALVGERARAGSDARAFFENLASYRAVGVEGLPERALELASSPRIGEADVVPILVRLAPLFHEEPYRRAADALAARFPHSPEAWRYRMLLVDHAGSPEATALAAEALAASRPGDDETLRLFVERASWSGRSDLAIRAREAWAKAHPDDAENRVALCDLYEGEGRAADAVPHWRILAASDGPDSTAAERLVDALFASGGAEEAMEWLERRANDPNATVEDRIAVAEQLFAAARLDRALRFYEAALAVAPEHALALLRVGQIRSWSNDPGGAIPYLERRLAATDEEAHLALFYLGEACWSVRRAGDARRAHEGALERLRAIEPRTAEQDTMLAKTLARLDRAEEARPIYERLLAGDPDNAGLLLDYADAMKASGDLALARALVDRARSLAPEDDRVLRLHGQLLIAEREPAAAVPVLELALAKYGPDAGVEADLGYACDLSGAWRKSAEAYRRSLVLQRDNQDVRRALRDVEDRIASFAQGFFEHRTAGDDRVLEAGATGSAYLDEDLTRLALELSGARFAGRAAAAGGGLEEVETLVARFRASVARRFGRADAYGGGVELYPGAAGDLPLGAWAGLRLEGYEPAWDLHVRLHLHELWSDPAAAAGLGGRSHGLRVEGRREIGGRCWVGGDLSLLHLSLDDPAGGRAEDLQFSGQVDFGCILRKGELAAGDRFDAGRLPLRVVGPYLDADSAGARGPSIAVWASYRAIRLAGDGGLPALVPVGDSFDYLFAAGRADVPFAKGLGARVEGYAGTDLAAGGFLWGLDAGVTYRPSPRFEAFLGASYGEALGRDEPGVSSSSVRFTLSWRW